MTMSDPIADMLTRIRNANTAKHDTVDIPASKMKTAIAEILLKEGYIKKFEIIEVDGFKSIHITLKYGKDKNEKNLQTRTSRICQCSRASKGTRRTWYRNCFNKQRCSD